MKRGGASAKKKRDDEIRYEVQKKSVYDFFQQDESRWQKVLPFLNGEGGLTLRLLDHCVTSYARRKKCETRTQNGAVENIYFGMQTALRNGLNKKRMDPFFRKHNSSAEEITMPDGTKTNVAQLTFFRWAILKNVLEFVTEHKKEIRADMSRVSKIAQRKRKERAENGGDMRVNEILVEVPADIADDAVEVARYKQTLEECFHKTKKRRRRICDEKMNTLARAAAPASSSTALDGVALVNISELNA